MTMTTLADDVDLARIADTSDDGIFVELIAEHPSKYMRHPTMATLRKSP